MPLEFRKQRDGRLRDVWFGRFEINGERFCYNLGIKIAGTPPKSMSLIVLKHYFQPGQEAFRQALQSAMPKLLTNGQKSPKDEMREILTGSTVKTWKKDKSRLEELLVAL